MNITTHKKRRNDEGNDQPSVPLGSLSPGLHGLLFEVAGCVAHGLNSEIIFQQAVVIIVTDPLPREPAAENGRSKNRSS
jgi:hypothetical protein